MAPVARWNICDTNGFVVVVEENAVYTSVASQVKVVLHVHDAVNVRCRVQISSEQNSNYGVLTGSGVTTTAGMTVDVLCPDFSTVSRVKVCAVLDFAWDNTWLKRTLNIITVGNANGVSGPQEVLSNGHDLAAIANSDGAVVTMGVVVAWFLVVLQTLHEWQEVCTM